MHDSIGYSEDFVAQYREKVAPLRKNVWNRLADFLETPAGFGVLVVLMGGSILSAFNLVPHPQEVLFCCMGTIFAFGLIIPSFKKYPPAWYTVSIATFLDMWPKSQVVGQIEAAIRGVRMSHPEAEFMIEYHADRKKMREKLFPADLVLWAWDTPYASTHKYARLVFHNNVEYRNPSE